MTTLTTVKMHGFLAKKYGKQIRVAGKTVEQIMNGLKSLLGPQFKEDIRTHDWHLVNADTLKSAKEAIAEEELQFKLVNKTLHFVPVVVGAAKKFANIIIGAVLIALSFVPGLQFLAPIGWSMIVGGVVNLLFAPKLPGRTSNAEEEGSYVYNGAVNVTSQGGLKPVIFGQVDRASSVVISSDYSTDMVANNVNTGTGSVDTSPTEYIIDYP